MSASISITGSMSGLRHEPELSVVLLPQLTPKLAPMLSMLAAICSALRVVVPLGRILLSRLLMPLLAEVSDGRPVRVAMVMETVGRRVSC